MKFEIELTHYLAAHSASIYAIEAQGKGIFYTGGEDGNILQWDLSKPSEARALAKTQASIYVIKAIGPNLLFIGTNNGESYVINSSDKHVVAEQHFGHTVFDIQLLKSSTEAIVSLADGYVARIALPDLTILQKEKVANGHVRVIQQAPHSAHHLLGSSDGCIYTIDNELQRIDTHLQSHADSVFSLQVVDEHHIFSGGKDAFLKHWSSKQGSLHEQNAVPAHLFTVNAIVKGPGPNEITTASRDKSIKIWDASTLLLQKVIDRSKVERASTHSVNRLVYLNTHQLASVGDDRIVRVYAIRRN